jgi:hypothetical protein
MDLRRGSMQCTPQECRFVTSAQRPRRVHSGLNLLSSGRAAATKAQGGSDGSLPSPLCCTCVLHGSLLVLGALLLSLLWQFLRRSVGFKSFR